MENKKSNNIEDIDLEIEKSEEVIEENIVSKKKSKKKYSVILSNPYYYIINVDGLNIVVKGKNNYKIGDTVSY